MHFDFCFWFDLCSRSQKALYGVLMASKRLHNSIRVSLAYGAQWDTWFQVGVLNGYRNTNNHSCLVDCPSSFVKAYKQGYQVGENRRKRENKSLTV